jgi:hypothetical protein
MLTMALEMEIASYAELHRDERGADGRRLVVRNDKARPAR